MRRRTPPDQVPLLPPHLAVFDPDDWPGRPAGAPGTDRQWKRMRWNRARLLHLRDQSLNLFDRTTTNLSDHPGPSKERNAGDSHQ